MPRVLVALSMRRVSAVFVQEFFEKNPVPIAQRTVQQSLENIRLNRCQLERDADAILKYLDGRA